MNGVRPPPTSARVEPAPLGFPVVGVGASAGGLEAFTELLRQLPADTGMGFVLVQHLDPFHPSALPHLLESVTALPVSQITDSLRIEANHVYVIPPGSRLTIEDGVLKLKPREDSRGFPRTIDDFFESLAHDQQGRAIGVVLSGTASDGTVGLGAIKAEGGITFAQDDSARYDSMPRSAIAAGFVDFVLSPAGIADELARIARHPYLAARVRVPRAESDHTASSAHENDSSALPSGGSGTPATGAQTAHVESLRRARDGGAADEFKPILQLLSGHSGVDFSLYKSTTVQRRIVRRMVLQKHDSLDAYAAFLRSDCRELEALYADVLISVTSFFRNPEAFDFLKSQVFPRQLEQRAEDPFRAWILGCSTGQEAYSIAMVLFEANEAANRPVRIQVFATDLNESLLEKSRRGFYAKSLVQDLSPERLERFFVEEAGGYRVVKKLRESVVFARQNLISDPPFSRMDLICCRNVLIYLEPSLQRRALPTFHYALKPGGVLFLGGSESVGPFTDLFEPLDRKHKIFVKKPGPSRSPDSEPRGAAPLSFPRKESPATASSRATDVDQGEFDALREADRAAARRFAPPAVLINDDHQILQFRGATGAYLEPPSGKASFDLLKMARPGLMMPLRGAIEEARQARRNVRRDNVRVGSGASESAVSFEIIPLTNLREPCFLVVFDGAHVRPDTARPAEASAAPGAPQADLARIAELERELEETRQYLLSVQEQHETVLERLQSASEEVQSANEEFQSINEELETSKEELESANEELLTVNEEMDHRNAELNRLNSDLVNLQTSTRLCIVLVGRDLAMRSFSPQAEKQFDLSATDLGRSVGKVGRHIVLSPADNAGDDLETFVADVIATVREREAEVRDRDGRWFSLRVRPYLTAENQVDGAVLVLIGIDVIKRSQQAIEDARDFAENIIETIREPILVLDGKFRVTRANRSYYQAFETTPGETEAQVFFELDGGQWNMPALRTSLEQILPQGAIVRDLDVQLRSPRLGLRTLRLNAGRLHQDSERSPLILLAFTDVSADKQLESELRAHELELTVADRHKTEFLAMLAHELRNPLVPIRNAAQILKSSPSRRTVVDPLADMIERQVGQIVRLVDDLLDVSRITLGRIHLQRERVEMGYVVQQATEAAAPSCEKLGHKLELSLPDDALYVSADSARMIQVVGNLVNNACKFTEPGGYIRLSLDREGEEAVVRVQDNGIGMAPAQIESMFEMFVQADSSLERTNSGLGIGLSLVKSLVAMHGGSVTAKSEGPGCGSEFTVRLPLLLDAPKRTPRVAPRRKVTARTILVVDDNRDAATSMGMLLELAGHEIQIAHDGETALAAAESFRPDVVLLDIGLPRLNGYEVALRIRQCDWGQDMLLVAVTGWGTERDRAEAERVGFDAHLVKPVELQVIADLLETFEAKRPVKTD